MIPIRSEVEFCGETSGKLSLFQRGDGNCPLPFSIPEDGENIHRLEKALGIGLVGKGIAQNLGCPGSKVAIHEKLALSQPLIGFLGRTDRNGFLYLLRLGDPVFYLLDLALSKVGDSDGPRG